MSLKRRVSSEGVTCGCSLPGTLSICLLKEHCVKPEVALEETGVAERRSCFPSSAWGRGWHTEPGGGALCSRWLTCKGETAVAPCVRRGHSVMR